MNGISGMLPQGCLPILGTLLFAERGGGLRRPALLRMEKKGPSSLSLRSMNEMMDSNRFSPEPKIKITFSFG
jgi:hypothetical protein